MTITREQLSRGVSAAVTAVLIAVVGVGALSPELAHDAGVVRERGTPA